MSEPITPVDPLPDGLRDRVNAGIHALIADISGTLYGAPANLREMAKVADLPPAAQRDYHLAVLAAAEMLRTQLHPVTSMAATLAGSTPDVTTTYADLGAAAGITRQAARERFPGAVLDAKPGRPKKQVTVTFQGGPEEWDGYRMEYPASTLEGDLDTVGAYLVVDAVSEDVPANARAHYAPESEDTRTVWVFQGWLPSPTS